MLNRTAIKSWADTHWYTSCEDGVVWTISGPLQLDRKRKELGCPSNEWWPVFLEPDVSDPQHSSGSDWLFFVRRSWTVGKLQGDKFQESAINPSDRRVVCTWFDAGPSYPGAAWGLNDCAHFVSECLAAGNIYGIGEVPGVPKLVGKLRSLGNTKTLLNLQSEEAASRIIKTGLLQPGDVIAYGGENNAYFPHGHSAIYLGSEAVANHTRFNHLDFKGLEGGRGNWKRYTSPGRKHPKVTIIHFSDDDQLSESAGFLDGWWEVHASSGDTYYYYFEKHGRRQLMWQRSRPARTSQQAPPSVLPQNKGYWFNRGGGRFTNCWTSTGSVEEFQLRGSMFDGVLNSAIKIFGKKI